jgi:hypothetical protein
MKDLVESVISNRLKLMHLMTSGDLPGPHLHQLDRFFP